ncbi:MAG: squalene--hopene cyclase, partial [Thermoleophilia bacterium]|nr:squalene--hopene cyclase [Thermoleophilia bacterium]
SWASIEGLFYAADRFLSWYVTFPWRPLRETAIRLCLEWIIRRQEADGAWGGIQPPWIYSLMALYTEGYPLDHAVLRAGLEAFHQHWAHEEDGAVYLQASESPIWDTVLSIIALLDAGPPANALPALERAADWLLSKQVRTWGDWKVYVKNARGGGWAFERANRFYPDVDDTAVA